jgi:hypothetical protein
VLEGCVVVYVLCEVVSGCVVLCFIPLFSDLKVKKFSNISLAWEPDFVFINQYIV